MRLAVPVFAPPLPDNTRPLARFDRGAAPDGLQRDRIVMAFALTNLSDGAHGRITDAKVKPVISKSTRSTDGVFLSPMNIVDNNLADIMSVSGSCEAVNLSAAAGISSLAQQAAAQGISVVVASGDSGAAGSDGEPPTPPLIPCP